MEGISEISCGCGGKCDACDSLRRIACTIAGKWSLSLRGEKLVGEIELTSLAQYQEILELASMMRALVAEDAREVSA